MIFDQQIDFSAFQAPETGPVVRTAFYTAIDDRLADVGIFLTIKLFIDLRLHRKPSLVKTVVNKMFRCTADCT